MSQPNAKSPGPGPKTRLETVYRGSLPHTQDPAEEALAIQALMEEFTCGSSRQTLERYQEKLKSSAGSAKNVCALCDEPGQLTPLGAGPDSLVCDDCGFEYWLCVNAVFPPATVVRHGPSTGPA